MDGSMYFYYTEDFKGLTVEKKYLSRCDKIRAIKQKMASGFSSFKSTVTNCASSSIWVFVEF